MFVTIINSKQRFSNEFVMRTFKIQTFKLGGIFFNTYSNISIYAIPNYADMKNLI